MKQYFKKIFCFAEKNEVVDSKASHALCIASPGFNV